MFFIPKPILGIFCYSAGGKERIKALFSGGAGWGGTKLSLCLGPLVGEKIYTKD